MQASFERSEPWPVRVLFLQLLQERLAVHPRHLEIDQREIQLKPPRLLQRIESVRSGHHLEVADLKPLCEGIQEADLVVNQENLDCLRQRRTPFSK